MPKFSDWANLEEHKLGVDVTEIIIGDKLQSPQCFINNYVFQVNQPDGEHPENTKILD